MLCEFVGSVGYFGLCGCREGLFGFTGFSVTTTSKMSGLLLRMFPTAGVHNPKWRYKMSPVPLWQWAKVPIKDLPSYLAANFRVKNLPYLASDAITYFNYNFISNNVNPWMPKWRWLGSSPLVILLWSAFFIQFWFPGKHTVRLSMSFHFYQTTMLIC